MPQNHNDRRYHPKYALITLAPVSYLRSLVVRAVHRHRTGLGSIPDINPLEKFSTSSEVPQNHNDLSILKPL